MKRFYLHLLVGFGLLRAMAVVIHYLGPSPWGGPVVLQPDRFIPDALLIEWGLLGVIALSGALVERLAGPRFSGSVRWATTAALAAHCLFTQVDLEVTRWLGQHMNLSFIRNFIGARDADLTMRILSGDPWFTGLSVVLALIPIPLGVAIAIRRRREQEQVGRWVAWTLVVFTLLAVASPAWFRPSEKRWRRIRPATIVLAYELGVEVTGAERPRNAPRARRDLLALVEEGSVSAIDNNVDDAVPASLGADPAYPLWRDTNVGSLTPAEFSAQPRDRRPDVIVIVFETMRGWSTGHLPSPEIEAGTPLIDAFVRDRAIIFPYLHSAGFPSVEGCMGMHLGIWPHFRKIIFSDYLHVRTRGYPEMLREAGYSTRALLGADPSFSNFTPWMERWFDQFEYIPGVHHDGPLVDRFIEIVEETRNPEVPRLLMLWTATTHPPYNIPESEGTLPADDSEARYAQAVRYADREIVRLLEYLEAQPEWNNSVVLILGDHAQPTPDQWRLTDHVGSLTPGHTWTNLIITGGWPGLPAPQRYEGDISHVDFAPTVLGLLNLRSFNHFMGRNLVPRLGHPDSNWPVTSFRYGDVAWMQGDVRLNFRLDGSTVFRWDVDRSDAISYGLLHPDEVMPTIGAPDGWPVERWRDAMRAWAELLDSNALMPPGAFVPHVAHGRH